MTSSPPDFPVYAVDDHPQILNLISIICEDHGLSCRQFASGADFVAHLDQREPGCVLLDMHMPGFSGTQVQEALAERASSFVVIAMTGYGDVNVAVKSMRLGALEFLEKPFGPEVLVAALQEDFKALRERLADDGAAPSLNQRPTVATRSGKSTRDLVSTASTALLISGVASCEEKMMMGTELP